MNPPDWQLPPGVDRGLWEYTHSAELAGRYDDSLAGSALAGADVKFCARQFDRPGKLVDLGCGTGRLLAAFAPRGFDCCGVDLSAEMLAVARAKVGPGVLLIQGNLAELAGFAPGAFDYAACLFSTLGMIRGRDNRLAFLRGVRALLAPGGRFVVHVHHRWYMGWTGVLGQVRRDLWKTLRGAADAGDRAGMIPGAGAAVTLHHFTRREILRDLGEAGFRVAEVQPVGVDGPLASRRFAGWRTYGYLIAATPEPG